MVNKKKKSSAKNIKYNKSKVQKIKQNVVINLTTPRTRASSRRTSQPRPPPPMPNIVSTFTPIMPPPPPPSAPMYPPQFMSASSANPFQSMMATQQREQQATQERQQRQQGNGLERTPEPERVEQPAPAAPQGETAEEKRRRILGRDLPPNPFARASEPPNPLKNPKMETKPAVVPAPSFGDELLNAVKNPKLRKRQPKEEVVVENSFEEALKTAKLKPVKPSEPDVSDMPELVEEAPVANVLGKNEPPTPQQVFNSPETENILVAHKPAVKTGIMTMTEMLEEQEGRRVIPNIPLPFPGQGRPVAEPAPETAIVFKPRRPTREERSKIYEKLVLQHQPKPVIQVEDKPAIQEVQNVPFRRAEAYDEEPQQHTETEEETDARKKYVDFLSTREDVVTSDMNSQQRSLAYRKKLQNEMRKRNLPYQIDSGKRNDSGIKKYKQMSNSEMINALIREYDTQKSLNF